MKLRPIDLRMIKEKQTLENFGTIPLWLIEPWEKWPKGLGLECQKCGYIWEPELSRVRCCPQCKGYFWNGNWAKIIRYNEEYKIKPEVATHGVKTDYLSNRWTVFDTAKCAKCGKERRAVYWLHGKGPFCAECMIEMDKIQEKILDRPRDLRPVNWEEELTKPMGEAKDMNDVRIRKEGPTWIIGECMDCHKQGILVAKHEYTGDSYCLKCYEAIDTRIKTQEERLKSGPKHGATLDDKGIDPELREAWRREAELFNTDNSPDLGIEEYVETGNCSHCKGILYKEVIQRNDKGEIYCSICVSHYKMHNGTLPPEDVNEDTRKFRAKLVPPDSTTSTPENQSNPL